MFCPNCGTNNEDGAVFCGNCGSKLDLNDFNETLNQEVNENSTQTNETNETVENTVAEETPVQTQDFVNNGFDQNAQAQGFANNGFDQNAQAQGFANNGFDQNAQTQGFANNGFDQNAQAQGFANNGFDQNAQTQGFANNGFNQNTQNFNNGANNGFKPAVNKKIIAIVGAVIAVVAVLAIFINVGKAGVDYKKTAKKYITALEQCDWDSAYDYLDLPKSEFLTKDALANAHADETGEKVTAITVAKGYSTASNLKGNEAVVVTYSTPTQSANSVNLLLSQTNDKYLLFFKKYKVSSEGIVYKDAAITVPKGMKLSVNGVEADAKYIKADNSKSGSTSDTYVIPYLYAGKNTVKVTSDIVEDYEETFNVTYDECTTSISYSDLDFKDSVEKEVMSKAENDLKTIAGAAYNKKDISELKGSVFVKDASSSLNNHYKNLVEDFHPSSRTFSSYSLSSIKTSMYDSYYRYDTDDGMPMMRVSVNYTISGKYTSTYSKEEKDATHTYDNYYYITYKYDGSNWLISDVYLNFYMY
ncbi:zinc ribbon domain-containing protein [Lachnospira multipara]|uniref:zinc ribbon domain-containing protein n=1 Tax=Lachnospira multipara TaxID=28051 RepID=UPI000481ADD3|nr:zinc ribbon domain-containing protein [Lachnospira multipara]